MKSTQKGFTLIELLVVIAIIGILSSVVLASLNGARVKARDAKRMSDMKQLQIALELYYGDNNQYPPNPSGLCGSCIEGGWSSGTLLANYLKPLPVDPTRAGTTNGYRYVYSNVNGRQSYTMLVYLEKNSTWCRYGTTPGHNSWNQVSDSRYYPVCK